jgi:hypothetical protein
MSFEAAPLSTAWLPSALPPALTIRPSPPPADVSYKRRHALLLSDYNHLHTIYVSERDARRDERLKFIAEVCRREEAETHAAIAQQEIARLQQLLNSKESAKTRAKDQVRLTGLVTVGEGMVSRVAQASARQDKRAAETAKEQHKEAHQQHELERRRALADSDTHVFDGRYTKKRADWDDIAFCLGVNTSSMNVADVIAEIFVQLSKRTKLQTEPRYAAIWKTLLKRSERAKTSADPSEGLEDA